MDRLRRRVLSAFPGRHLVYGFAYGSGVFRQAGRRAYDDDGADADAAAADMVDMMFVVDDARGFHRDNLAANPGHYSRIRHLGAAAVAAVQTAAGAGVYFNTHVRLSGGGGGGGDDDGPPVLCKYGVIDARDFRLDLSAWRTLYTAGRLHKPVVTLLDRGGGCGGGDGRAGPTAAELIARNLESALHAALLQLPETFAERELYAAVAGLSYRGDFRMIVGEDKNKVANIVRPQVDAFRALYAPAVLSVGADRLSVRGPADVVQDKSAGCKLYHLRGLPDNLIDSMLDAGRAGQDRDAALLALADRPDLPALVRRGLCKIVFLSSLVQSVKGIPTAGLRNSVVYSYNKLDKMVRSMWP